MIPAGNKTKRYSSVNHTTKTIHQHHHLYFLLCNFTHVFESWEFLIQGLSFFCQGASFVLVMN